MLWEDTSVSACPFTVRNTLGGVPAHRAIEGTYSTMRTTFLSLVDDQPSLIELI